ENARAELARQVGFIESNQFDIGSPFSLTEDVIVRASTGNPLDKDIATIAGDLAYLKSALSNALAEIRPERQRPNRIRTMTSTGKWIKIIVELVEPPSSVTLEISPEDSVFDSLSAIWGLQSIDAKFRPDRKS